MKKAYQKIVREDSIQTIDSDSGELIDVSIRKTKVLVKGKEEFFYLYSAIMGVLHEVGKGPDLGILSVIMFRHVTTQGIFNASKTAIKDIAERCNLSEATVKRSLKKLIEADVLKKVSKGEYSLNANFIWKGTASTRDEKLRFNLELETERAESFF